MRYTYNGYTISSSKVECMTSNEDVNSTSKLLRLIGSPFSPAEPSEVDQNLLKQLYYKSSRNRMAFLYLETMKRNELSDLSTLYNREDKRRADTNDAIAKASRVLADARIDHVVFKTIRPYEYTTADIDILIFEDTDYLKSIIEMRNVGYKIVANGPRSATLWDQRGRIGVDLYQQVAASFIIYIDKQTLVNNVKTIELPNHEVVRTLKPEADLACIIAHSIMKEQMYTLSEYYTFVYYLRQMNIEDFLNLAKQNNITHAAKTHATITALLHKVAHQTIPKKLQQILNQLGEENLEKARIIKNNFETPHKYHPITVVKSLAEIAKGKETRKSIAIQLVRMLDPNISKDFLKKLVDHAFRKAY